MSDLRLTEHFIIFDVFVGTYGDHSMTSDLFSQKAKCPQEFPAVN